MNGRPFLTAAIDLFDLIAPRSCVFCAADCIDDEEYVCEMCLDDLPWNEPAISPVPGIFVRSIAMLRYEYPINAAIQRFKFDKQLFYGSAFAEILCRAIPLLPKDIDAVLPVPLHWYRKARRGFNQALEIAKPLAKKLHVPIVTPVVRRRSTPFQSGLGADERTRNLKAAFEVSGPIEFEHVLIVDDVTTTGATLNTLATVLQRSGADRVSSLCLARAV